MRKSICDIVFTSTLVAMNHTNFCSDLIEINVASILRVHKKKHVKLESIYDLRAIGPEKYRDYLVMSTQLEAELNLILCTLPKIRELSKKIETTRQDIVEAITDHVDT